MSKLKVEITADGMKRSFSGTGDGAELVAAFRVWLSSPDLWLQMAEGADRIDQESATLAGEMAVRSEPDVPFAEVEISGQTSPQSKSV